MLFRMSLCRTLCGICVAIMMLLGSDAPSFGFPAEDIFTNQGPGVVAILSQAESGSVSIGAGSFVTSDWHIVTNAHVIWDNDSDRPCRNVEVYLMPGSIKGDINEDLSIVYSARIVAYDKDLDLALLQPVTFDRRVPLITIENPENVRVGAEVVAIGHPESGGLWSLTYGRISGQIANQQGVEGKHVYQTDTSVNRGNSGGPLIDARGNMVGINTNISRLSADGLPITGINFALRADVIKNWIESRGIHVQYASLIPPQGAGPAASDTSPANPSGAMGNKGGVAPEQAAPHEATPQQAAPHEATPQQAAPPQPEGSETLKSDTLLTPVRPYQKSELYIKTERNLTDLKERMKKRMEDAP